MAITPEQAQAELERRKQAGLFQEEAPAEASTKTPSISPEQARDELIRRGALPSNVELFNQIGRAVPPPDFFQIRPPTASGPAEGAHKKRRLAFEQLVDRGINIQDIDHALAVKREIEPVIPPGTGRVVGDIVGGVVAGALIPGPVDDAAIASRILASLKRGALTATGAIAGETAESILRREGLPELEQILDTGASSAAAQVGFEGALAGARGLLKHSPLTKKASPYSAELLDKFVKAGGVPPPTAYDKRLTVKLAESLSRGSVLGGDIFKGMDEQNALVLRKMADGMVDDLLRGVDRLEDAETGRLVADIVQQPFGTRWTMVDELFSPMYDKLDDLAKYEVRDVVKKVPETIPGRFDLITGKPLVREVEKVVGKEQVGAVVETKALRRFAKDMLRKNQLTIREEAKGAKGAILTAMGKSELEKIANLPDNVGFSVMRDIRSGLLKKERQLAFEKSADAGLVRKLGGLTREALFDDKLAQKVPTEAKKLLREVTALYKQASGTWDEAFSKSVVKKIAKNPAKAAKTIINTNDAVSLENAKKIITGKPVIRNGKLSFVPDAEGKEAWNQVVAGHLANTLESKKSLGSALESIEKLDPKVKSILFPKENLARLRELEEIEKAITARPAGAGLFAKGLQFTGGPAAGGAFAAFGGGAGGAGLVSMVAGSGTFFAPVVYATAAANPKIHKLLIAGLKAPPRTKQSAIAIGKLVKAITENERKTQERLQKAIKESQTRRTIEHSTIGAGDVTPRF